MCAFKFNRVLAVLALLVLAACASPPSRINNICSVFEQQNGFFNNWHSAAKRTERKYGIPVHVLMATVRKESGFKANARPPRNKILGFIPGKRASSAYGYSQALNGTWSQYVSESGNWGARRNSFSDAVDFVGWYHSKTVANHGVSPNDAFRLYLAYYSGWSGYARGSWQSNASIQKYARDTQTMANNYAAQLASCR
ncbi:hypothetical protein [Mesorhizobium sp. CAU 1732]|uniref:transglycosylase SLT domain-containing protein n=1 Tax=Mesorhizobium sp. CAU 1732 TaxID=3140358 RepID=UPI003261AE5A